MPSMLAESELWEISFGDGWPPEAEASCGSISAGSLWLGEIFEKGSETPCNGDCKLAELGTVEGLPNDWRMGDEFLPLVGLPGTSDGDLDGIFSFGMAGLLRPPPAPTPIPTPEAEFCFKSWWPEEARGPLAPRPLLSKEEDEEE